MKPLLLALALLMPLPVLEAAHAQAPQVPQAPAATEAPPENALKYLQAARSAYKRYYLSIEPTSDEARGVIEQNAEVFPLLEAALKAPLRYDERLFELPPGAPNGATPMFPFEFVRLAARLLILRSGVQVRDGDMDGALESSLQAVALGLKVQQDGPLMSALSGYAIEALGLQALQRQLALKLSPEQLKAGARRLLELEALRPTLSKMLSGDREESLRSMGAMLAQGHGPETGFGAERQKAALDVVREEFEAEDELLARPFPLLRGLDFETQEDDDQDADAPDAAPAPGRFDARVWAQVILKTTRPTKGRTMFQRARAQARLSLLATVLAARAYKIERKEWPASLQVLVPDFLPSVPLDPFELNAPLQLKAQGESIKIYSVGPDGLDDGGRLSDRPSERNGVNLSPDSLGDIAAPAELLKP